MGNSELEDHRYQFFTWKLTLVTAMLSVEFFMVLACESAERTIEKPFLAGVQVE